MPYSAEISRESPVAIFFLIDQSASMKDAFGGAEEQGDAAPSKARVLADVVNRLIQNLVLRCAKEEGVRDYFYIQVIGYGDRVTALIKTPEQEFAKGLVPISHLADYPLRLEERFKRVPDGAGGLVQQKVRFPVWFDPVAKNGTPMCQAIDFTTGLVRDWNELHPQSYPPIVMNITDGEATDGDPLRFARLLQEQGNSDGEVLLFNIHLSDSMAAPIELPDTAEGLPDDYALLLYQMSSILPFSMRSSAEQDGYRVNLDTRGFVFNADPSSLIRFLEIGTRPGNLR